MKIPTVKNVSVTEFEKLSKCKDLEMEVKKLWHVKTVAIPVVIGALSVIKKSIEKTSRIPGSLYLAEMQKLALTGTANIHFLLYLLISIFLFCVYIICLFFVIPFFLPNVLVYLFINM